ncbi:MAG TPA: DUF882 domain-containing protein [Polyangiaceae bacterium]|nr:DUF882 domain-containing protein [Polyangiaceae bacterium]
MTAAAVLFTIAPAARGDVSYVVQPGHSLEAIASRYRVSIQAIVEANHLKDPDQLKPGQILVIPGVTSLAAGRDGKEKAEKEGPRTAASHLTEAGAHKGARGWTHGENGIIHAVRSGEQFRIRVKDSHGHIPDTALRAFERLMKERTTVHPAEPRLLALLGLVSDHFGGRTIEVISGYRAYTPSQYNPHSNHNYGRAIDFRIVGVRNEELRDFCRTLRSTGCGYYPNSTFVHLDVRETKAFWVDWSRPGEPPSYDGTGGPEDEGGSDVAVDGTPVQPSTPDPSSPPGSANTPAPRNAEDPVKAL